MRRLADSRLGLTRVTEDRDTSRVNRVNQIWLLELDLREKEVGRLLLAGQHRS